MKPVLTAAMAALIATPAIAGAQTLTDERLLAYANAFFAPEATLEPNVHGDGRALVGVHHGRKVLAQGPCDSCDGGRERVIYYELKPGEDCERAGGKRVDYGFASEGRAGSVVAGYCVPYVLIQAQLFRGTLWRPEGR